MTSLQLLELHCDRGTLEHTSLLVQVELNSDHDTPADVDTTSQRFALHFGHVTPADMAARLSDRIREGMTYLRLVWRSDRRHGGARLLRDRTLVGTTRCVRQDSSY
jgi:hypothetical protein